MLKTGTAVGIALREQRICKGFLWRYSGVSKEQQFSEQPVVKICCKNVILKILPMQQKMPIFLHQL